MLNFIRIAMSIDKFRHFESSRTKSRLNYDSNRQLANVVNPSYDMDAVKLRILKDYVSS